MRSSFCRSMVSHLDPLHSVFLTGDLGFMALEPLRDHLGSRFINAGVAEQNMISVAAGLARTGLDTWAYSIAPFCYARPFEQIRNDLCLHGLPVRLVGNGGGYGYGVMGATHHAIEDYGTLLALQKMRVFVPAFDEDVEPAVSRIRELDQPTYLRLGRCERPAELTLPEYAPWRKLVDGEGPVLVVVGPIVGSYCSAVLSRHPGVRPEVWVVTEMPLNSNLVPPAFCERLDRGAELWVAEEHVAQGGFGQALAAFVLEQGLRAGRFRHFAARGYPSGRAGSQEFYRRESGIDSGSLLRCLAARGSTEN